MGLDCYSSAVQRCPPAITEPQPSPHKVILHTVKTAFLKDIILFLLLPFQHFPISLLVQMLMCSPDPTQFITVGSLTFIRFSGAPYPATLCKGFLPAEIIQLGNITPSSSLHHG